NSLLDDSLHDVRLANTPSLIVTHSNQSARAIIDLILYCQRQSNSSLGSHCPAVLKMAISPQAITDTCCTQLVRGRGSEQVTVIKLSMPFLIYFSRGGNWVHDLGPGPSVRLSCFF
ncbi:hypothetical protein J6590_098411, partial [Homalodisca vitripennis]